jgi:hypothetical protein
VTFRLEYFDQRRRWVDELDQRSQTVHIAEPRIEVDAVTPWPPFYNRPITVFHRWLGRDEPDPDGAHFDELIAWSDQLDLLDCQTFVVDYCSLPQKPRTQEEEAVFRERLATLHRYFQQSCLVLGGGSEDYRTRAWCTLELMLTAMEDSIITPDVLRGPLMKAYEGAQTYTKNSTYTGRSFVNAFGPLGVTNKTFARWTENVANVAVYNASLKGRKVILKLFRNELQATNQEDITTIVELLKELCFRGWRT